jgi:hypothetical protein
MLVNVPLMPVPTVLTAAMIVTAIFDRSRAAIVFEETSNEFRHLKCSFGLCLWRFTRRRFRDSELNRRKSA